MAQYLYPKIIPRHSPGTDILLDRCEWAGLRGLPSPAGTSLLQVDKDGGSAFGAAYLTIFCRINAVRRSVTGSRSAGTSDDGPFASDGPSTGSSRKDDDRSNDLVRRPCGYLRKT